MEVWHFRCREMLIRVCYYRQPDVGFPVQATTSKRRLKFLMMIHAT